MSKESVSVRKLHISDIYALHIMYDSLSDETKRFFHPGFVGLKSISPQWVLAQLALVASSFTFSKRLLLRVYPFAVFLAIVSVNKSGELVGFAFVKVKSRLSRESFLGELGIFLKNGYQRKYVGSKLLSCLLVLAKNEKVEKIYLTVLANNLVALHLYEKYGFNTTRRMPQAEIWHGQRFDSVEMSN